MPAPHKTIRYHLSYLDQIAPHDRECIIPPQAAKVPAPHYKVPPPHNKVPPPPNKVPPPHNQASAFT